MTFFFIVVVVLIFFVATSGRKNRNNTTEKFSKYTMTNADHTGSESSIVDITGVGYRIDPSINGLKRYASGVPYWGHRYIYSYDEIKYANPEQLSFYKEFKCRFERGEYLDVEGNSNYVFILLFDLLNEFDRHNLIAVAEEQMKTLVTYYPRTKQYAIPFLIKRLEQKGAWTESVELRGRHIQSGYGGYSFEGNYWGLGARYKAKLKLDEADTKLLDTLYYSSNNFFEVEFCALEILKLFLRTIKKLRELYEQEGSTLDTELASLIDVILKKHYRYHSNSWNYNNGQNTARNDIYLMILKHCENAVREHYNHKRKLNIEFSSVSEVKLRIEEKIFSKLNLIMPELMINVAVLDTQTDIELYAQNTSRWKIRFEQLIGNFSSEDCKEFLEQIMTLGDLNKKNPSIENIFYEASKFIAPKDKVIALNLYLRYLHHDLKSAVFDNKPLTKTIQKNLFTTPQQMQDFETVVTELINTKNLENALAAVSDFYKIKRKKIQLDKDSIQEVNIKHAGTVELLNEYLEDEYEEESSSVSIRRNETGEAVIDIKHQEETLVRSIYLPELSLTATQMETLMMFAKAGFVVNTSELEIFARWKGQFTGGLVDGINEACYECLDDILIEEDNGDFIISEPYYERILVK